MPIGYNQKHLVIFLRAYNRLTMVYIKKVLSYLEKRVRRFVNTRVTSSLRRYTINDRVRWLLYVMLHVRAAVFRLNVAV